MWHTCQPIRNHECDSLLSSQSGKNTTVQPLNHQLEKGKYCSVGTERPGAVRSVLYRAAMVVLGAKTTHSHAPTKRFGSAEISKFDYHNFVFSTQLCPSRSTLQKHFLLAEADVFIIDFKVHTELEKRPYASRLWSPVEGFTLGWAATLDLICLTRWRLDTHSIMGHQTGHVITPAAQIKVKVKVMASQS